MMISPEKKINKNECSVAVMVDNLNNVQENIKDTKGVIKSRRRMQWTKEKRTKSHTMVDEILQKTKD